MVFDTLANRAYRLDAAAAQVWRACDGHHSIDELLESIDLDRQSGVEQLAHLTELGLVDLSGARGDLLSPEPDQLPAGVSRRALFRRTAAVGAAAAVGGSAVAAVLGVNGGTSTAGAATTPTCTAGESDATDFAASGLTGATAASRYAGATTGGQPTSGTFNQGDFVIDLNGAIWICTTAGTCGPVGNSGTSIWSGVGGYDNGARYHDLLASTFDPHYLVTGKRYGSSNGSGLLFEKVYLFQGGPISQICTGIGYAGSNLSNCYMGVYDSNGNLLGATADQSSNWQSVSAANTESGFQNLTAQAGQSLTRNAGEYLFLALMAGSGNTPTFVSAGVWGNQETQNAGLKQDGSPQNAWDTMNTGGTGYPSGLPAVFNNSQGSILGKNPPLTQSSVDTIWIAIR